MRFLGVIIALILFIPGCLQGDARTDAALHACSPPKEPPAEGIPLPPGIPPQALWAVSVCFDWRDRQDLPPVVYSMGSGGYSHASSSGRGFWYHGEVMAVDPFGTPQRAHAFVEYAEAIHVDENRIRTEWYAVAHLIGVETADPLGASVGQQGARYIWQPRNGTDVLASTMPFELLAVILPYALEGIPERDFFGSPWVLGDALERDPDAGCDIRWLDRRNASSPLMACFRDDGLPSSYDLHVAGDVYRYRIAWGDQAFRLPAPSAAPTIVRAVPGVPWRPASGALAPESIHVPVVDATLAPEDDAPFRIANAVQRAPGGSLEVASDGKPYLAYMTTPLPVESTPTAKEQFARIHVSPTHTMHGTYAYAGTTDQTGHVFVTTDKPWSSSNTMFPHWPFSELPAQTLSAVEAASAAQAAAGSGVPSRAAWVVAADIWSKERHETRMSKDLGADPAQLRVFWVFRFPCDAEHGGQVATVSAHTGAIVMMYRAAPSSAACQSDAQPAPPEPFIASTVHDIIPPGDRATVG